MEDSGGVIVHAATLQLMTERANVVCDRVSHTTELMTQANYQGNGCMRDS
jgi:hypothetical protein